MKPTVALLLMCLLAVLFTPVQAWSQSATSTGTRSSWDIVDSKAGVIRIDRGTGECWMLSKTDGGSWRWDPIAEVRQEQITADGLAEAIASNSTTVVDKNGSVLGLQISKDIDVNGVSLKKGDIAQTLGGHEFTSGNDLRRVFRQLRNDNLETAELIILREGKTQTFKIKLK